jgi:hypothetical protein
LLTLLNQPAMAVHVPELLAATTNFATPDKDFASTLVVETVNLFLHDVKENRELRDPVPVEKQLGTVVRRHRAPIRVDCTYMVTTWSKAAGDQRIRNEHRLLGQALNWLTRFPVLPADILQGELALMNVDDPTIRRFPLPPTMVAQFDPDKDSGEFWTALGIPPRPAISLVVTVAMDLGAPFEEPAVTSLVADYYRKGA